MEESNSLISQWTKATTDHSFHTLTWSTGTSPAFYSLTSSVIPDVTTYENHIYSILRAANICTKLWNYDSVPVTSKLVNWHIVLSPKLTLISADLKVQNPVAVVGNNRLRLWTKKSLTGIAISNPINCTANTRLSVQNLDLKENGLPRTCHHPGTYHKGQKEYLSFILPPAQQFWFLSLGTQATAHSGKRISIGRAATPASSSSHCWAAAWQSK